jgi:drug/metabolite transporter (DMT)-like permease
MPSMNRRLQANFVLVGCSLIWGGTFVVVQGALADVAVFPFLAARFTLATLLMALLAGGEIRRLTRTQIWRGMKIGVLMFGGFAFQTAGLLYTSSSKTAFITGLSVVLVPIFTTLFWKGHTNTWVFGGALTALTGLYFLTVPASGLSNFQSGNLLVLGCAVCFAFHIILIGRYGPGFSVGALSFLQIVTTTALSLAAFPVLALISRSSLRFRLTVGSALAIVATSLLATVLAFSMQVWAQRRTTATSAALIFSLEPLFAALASFLVLHERLGLRSLTGTVLILAGIVVVELKGPAPAAADSVIELPPPSGAAAIQKQNIQTV